MRYEVFPDTDAIDVWRAEAIDHDSEGECYVVIFSGPDSERRAREYTAWMNAMEAVGVAWSNTIIKRWEGAEPIAWGDVVTAVYVPAYLRVKTTDHG